MKTFARFLILGLVLLNATACSKPPVQSQKFANRAQWHEYIDGLDIPDGMRQAVKDGTAQVSGKYINNMVPYLDLRGDPMKALVKKYGMKAEVGLDGVDIRPAVDAAVADLIASGDKKQGLGGYNNRRWWDSEELNGGAWGEGESYGSQRAKILSGDFKRAPGERATLSQIDTGK